MIVNRELHKQHLKLHKQWDKKEKEERQKRATNESVSRQVSSDLINKSSSSAIDSLGSNVNTYFS